MSQALKGIKVVDLSRILAGPWASQMLADMGAEVFKIERPGKGDDTRHWGPPFIKTAQNEEPAQAAYYHSANRNKTSKKPQSKIGLLLNHRLWPAWPICP